MIEKRITIPENTLLFLLDKVEECYKDECKKLVDRILKGE